MKSKLTLSVDSDLIRQARVQGINLSELLTVTLEQQTRAKPCDKCGGTGRVFKK